jgi:hypothetical protein
VAIVGPWRTTEHRQTIKTMTTISKPVRRVTQRPFGWGKRARRLVVSIEPGDIITLREQRCRKSYSIAMDDLMWHLIRLEAARVRLEKRKKKTV